MAVTTAAKKLSRPFRILLIEDNPADVYLLEMALKRRKINYKLLYYAYGEQAIRALQKGDCLKPDLILADLNLPRRDGFDVLTAVRGKPSLVGVRVGILTSSDARKDRHRILLLGAQRYIKTPSTLEDFLEHVGGTIQELLTRDQ